MIFRLLLAGGALMGAATQSDAEMCNRRGTYHLAYDADWPMSISIRPGSTCEATFGSFGGANLTFKRLLLVSPPTRGKIKLREGGYYIYTAPTTAGEDKFTLRVCGSENNSPGCATLNYAVTVN
jgi:hypothetical protein